MKAEKVILAFVALFFGLIVAGTAFYFIQSARGTKPQTQQNTQNTSPTKAPSNELTLVLDKPKDEEVVENKLVTVSGRTEKDAIVVVSTPLGDEVITPAENGSFTATITIDSGYNEIIFTAIASTGEETKVVRTITYSTEDF